MTEKWYRWFVQLNCTLKRPLNLRHNVCSRKLISRGAHLYFCHANADISIVADAHMYCFCYVYCGHKLVQVTGVQIVIWNRDFIYISDKITIATFSFSSGQVWYFCKMAVSLQHFIYLPMHFGRYILAKLKVSIGRKSSFKLFFWIKNIISILLCPSHYMMSHISTCAHNWGPCKKNYQIRKLLF